MQTATNPQTGERVALIDGEWQPLQTATNSAGDKVAYNGSSWEAVGAPNAQESLVSGQREEISQDATLQFGPWDTGIGVPQWVDEGLSGAGREMMELASAGEHQGTADHLLDESGAATGGAILADIAAMSGVGKVAGVLAKVAHAAPKIAQALNWGSKAFTAPTTLPQGAVSGAALGGLLSDGSASDRAIGAAQGATGGLLGVAAPRVLGNVVAPKVNAAAQKLLNKDIPLTPGQMGPSWMNAAEEHLTSLPLVGTAVAGARREAIKGWNRSVVNEALGEIGEALPRGTQAGSEAFDYAYKTIGKTYDDILENMPVTVTDDMVSMFDKPEGWQYLGKSAKNHWNRAVNDVMDSMDNGVLSGNGFKRVEAQLRERAGKLIKSQNPADNDAGQMLKGLHSELIGAASDQHPGLGLALKKADKSYAQISAAAKAKNAANADELFTPAQLARQLKKRSTDRATASGRAPGQERLQSALDVLPNRVPDSGTAQRAMMGSMLGMGGAAAAGAPISPMIFALPAAAALPYTKGAGALLRGYAQPGPARAALGQAMGEAIAPRLGLLGGAIGAQ